jgi:hypothetical protein
MIRYINVKLGLNHTPFDKPFDKLRMQLRTQLRYAPHFVQGYSGCDFGSSSGV